MLNTQPPENMYECLPLIQLFSKAENLTFPGVQCLYSQPNKTDPYAPVPTAAFGFSSYLTRCVATILFSLSRAWNVTEMSAVENVWVMEGDVFVSIFTLDGCRAECHWDFKGADLERSVSPLTEALGRNWITSASLPKWDWFEKRKLHTFWVIAHTILLTRQSDFSGVEVASVRIC